MALVKYNNNSISSITTAGQLASGSLVPISEQTASGSASISFTSGIDSTYPIYKFEFINIHPQTDDITFQFNMSTDGGSNYNVTKTTTFFVDYHFENDVATDLTYETATDLAQSTAYQTLDYGVGADNDQQISGYLYLYNPSSTTFVKHFMGRMANAYSYDVSHNTHVAGYGNTTSAINGVRFQMSSGNIDSGTIKLYGIRDS